MFPKSLMKHFKVFGSRFTELYAKLEANMLLNFSIHHRQNERQSRKSTRVKTVRVHCVVSGCRLME
jgi:hypothetical protein